MPLIQKKDLTGMSTLRKEEEIARRRAQESELIDEMGQESEIKSRSSVNLYFKEMEQEENAFRDEAYELLTGMAKDKIQYNKFLVAVFSRFANQESIPPRFEITAKPTIEGIVVGIRGTRYQGAFKTCGIPQYDYNACKILAVRLGNTIAKLMGFTKQTENGIILPDVEDLDKFGVDPKKDNNKIEFKMGLSARA